MDTSDNELFDDGTATGGSATTLQDTTKSWTTDFWAGGWVFIWQGTGAGEIRAISANTANTLTIASGTTPDTTSDYVIIKTTIDGNATAVNCFNNFADNVRIEGFRIRNATSHLITLDTPATGLKGCSFYRNAFVDPGLDCFQAPKAFQIDLYRNYFSVKTSRYGIVLPRGVFYVTPRENVFIAESTGSGTGLYAYGPKDVSMTGAAASLNTFIDLSIGVKAANGAVIEQGSSQTYTNCTTPYTPSAASDPAYIN